MYILNGKSVIFPYVCNYYIALTEFMLFLIKIYIKFQILKPPF